MENNERGVSSVEFALVLPLLLLVLFAIIEYSLLLYDKAVITNASREGARKGIVFGTPRVQVPEITNAASFYCESNLISFGSAPASPVITVTPGACVNTGDTLTVTVSYPYTYLLLPNFMTLGGGGITLTAKSAMRCE